MFIDLTLPFDSKIKSFPGTPNLIVEQLATIENDGWNSKRLSFNSHYSTHIDAPFHMLQEGKTLSDFPVEKFIGEALVINVVGMKVIDVSTDNIKNGDIVFFYTGHSSKIYEDTYFETFPVLSKSLAEKLIEKKISIVGFDTPSPDNAPYNIHIMLFKNNILIVENLTNLKKLSGKRFECTIAPLKIKDADGAPCRVIGKII